MELERTSGWRSIARDAARLPLAQLAERAGVTPGEVAAALERAGLTDVALDDLPPEPGDTLPLAPAPLPTVRAARSSLRPGSKDHQIMAHASLLGRVPDAEVARRAGVSVRTIASFRARHDIPGYSGPRRSTRPQRTPRERVAPPRAVAPRRAWEVEWVDGDTRHRGVVLAADLDAALRAARGAVSGTVVGVRLAGRLLE